MLYEDAGVRINVSNELISFIKSIVGESRDSIGPFSAPFDILPHIRNLKEPVLVTSTDGVGTKILLALEADKLEGIGQDLVAMVVNDIICSGAKPIIFLDYYSTSELDLSMAKKVLRGIVNTLKKIDCLLMGGETAELPGFYKEKKYFDIVGFGIGIAERSRIPNPSKVRPGDIIFGLPSSGFHSNGYSLIRKVLREKGIDLSSKPLQDKALMDLLLEPTKLYVHPVLRLFELVEIKGAAHITGGGIPGNVKRVIPQNLDAVIHKNWDIPQVFKWIQKTGEIPEEEMFRVFNMGIGFVLIVDKRDREKVEKILYDLDERFYFIGEIKEGEGRVLMK
jgi:phosphoribosylformylglycinamidine cyclo-ligase